MERNIRCYDISDPLSALHFVSFLLRLKEREAALKKAFTPEIKAKFLLSLTDGSWKKWMMPERSKAPTLPTRAMGAQDDDPPTEDGEPPAEEPSEASAEDGEPPAEESSEASVEVVSKGVRDLHVTAAASKS